MSCYKRYFSLQLDLYVVDKDGSGLRVGLLRIGNHRCLWGQYVIVNLVDGRNLIKV